MKAVICKKYSQPKDLVLEDVPRPKPKEDEILIEIKATAINDYDWSLTRGRPSIYRLLFGIKRPKNPIPGMELSGLVKASGANVKEFKIGDAVFGDISDYGFGSFAEFICVNKKAVVKKPLEMKFVEAAAIPHAFCLAYQGLMGKGRMVENQKILIIGAGGGVGAMSFQLAKTRGAVVHGVDTGKKLNQMLEIGFDRVFDYKEQNITKLEESYDLVLDTKTCHFPIKYLSLLKKEGKYITVGGKLRMLLSLAILKPFINKLSSKQLDIVALKVNGNLKEANALFSKGILKPIIDGPHSFEKTPDLIQYFGEGKHFGKIVVEI